MWIESKRNKLKKKQKLKTMVWLWRIILFEKNFDQCLLTRVNLLTRGIPCEESCVCCDLMSETHMHVFFVCSKTVNWCEHIDIYNIIQEMLPTIDNFTTMLLDLLNKLVVSALTILDNDGSIELVKEPQLKTLGSHKWHSSPEQRTLSTNGIVCKEQSYRHTMQNILINEANH